MNRPDKRWAEIAKSMQTINNKQVNRDLGEPQGHPTRSTAVLKPVKGLDRAVRGLRAPLDDGQRSSRVASASLGLGHVDLDGLGLASSRFGIVRVNWPSLYSALTLTSSMESGREKLRAKAP